MQTAEDFDRNRTTPIPGLGMSIPLNPSLETITEAFAKLDYEVVPCGTRTLIFGELWTSPL